MTIADVNGDGVPDLIAPGASGLGPVVLLGLGDGTFAQAVSGVSPVFGSWTAVGDCDGDGHLDVISQGFHSLGVGFGDGSGTHWTPAGFTPSCASGMAAADFDGDGRTDLAMVGDDHRLQVLFGRADRSFDTIPVEPDSIDGFVDMVRVADFNHDGHPDVVVLTGSNPGSVVVFLGHGNRTFDYRPFRGDLASTAYDLAVGDATQDGSPDLVIHETTQVGLLRGNGDGSFAPEQKLFDVPSQLGGVVLGDVTGDAVPDIVVSDFSAGQRKIVTHPGTGGGTFGAAIVNATHRPLASLALADLNGDEQTDLVALDQSENGVRIGLGDGAGHFGDTPVDLFYNGFVLGVAASDLNRDGFADIVSIVDGAGQVLHVALGGQGRLFTDVAPRTLIPNEPAGMRLAGLMDLDEDSVADLVIIRGGTRLGVFHGNADGTFGAEHLVAVPTVGSAFSYDVNGDGHRDLIVPASDSVRVLMGNGALGFGPAVSTPVGGLSVLSSASADFDGDGQPDVELIRMRTEFGWPTPIVERVRMKGNSDGTFAASAPVATSYPSDVESADLNRDGRSDLIVETYSGLDYELYSGSIAAQLQQSDGPLGPIVSGPRPAHESPPAVFTIDGDTAPDRVAALYGTIDVWRGDGSGGFEPEPGYSGFDGESTVPFALGDFDGDGHVDMAGGDQNFGVRVLFGRDTVAPAVQWTEPYANALIGIGIVTHVSWTATDASGLAGADLFASRHGAAGPYLPVALGLGNAGSYDWTAPGPPSDSIVLKVVVRDSDGNVSIAKSAGLLRAVDAAGVPGATTTVRRTAIRGLGPNPSRGSIALRLELPVAARTRVRLLDVQGRTLGVLFDGERPAGESSLALNLAGRVPLAPGWYVVRVDANHEVATARVAITR
ncbi:MAG TPA: FG-GAP-like repeat-containing protein [Candidatus Saccharimonadaceae bacterium]|nr:FG-GAP-like repeat-containing protein [Candidatus Saccharimonadaceae bacterium]